MRKPLFLLPAVSGNPTQHCGVPAQFRSKIRRLVLSPDDELSLYPLKNLRTDENHLARRVSFAPWSGNVSLPKQYRKLSDLFDQVLSLSHMILFELERGGTEEHLKSLLEKKDGVGRNIAKLTQEIASSGTDAHPQSNLRTLAEVKPILKQIEKQASLLEAVEKRIQNLAKLRHKD